MMTPRVRRRVMWTEVLFACVVFALGALWSLPNDSFGLASNYRVMASIAPEAVWGAGFMAWGVAWMLAIWRGPLVTRRAGAMFGGGALIFVGSSWFLSNAQTVNGWVIFACGIGAIATRLDLR